MTRVRFLGTLFSVVREPVQLRWSILISLLSIVRACGLESEIVGSAEQIEMWASENSLDSGKRCVMACVIP